MVKSKNNYKYNGENSMYLSIKKHVFGTKLVNFLVNAKLQIFFVLITISESVYFIEFTKNKQDKTCIAKNVNFIVLLKVCINVTINILHSEYFYCHRITYPLLQRM